MNGEGKLTEKEGPAVTETGVAAATEEIDKDSAAGSPASSPVEDATASPVEDVTTSPAKDVTASPVEDVAVALPPMPKNWLPNEMLVFCLFGRLSNSEDVEFSQELSSGPSSRNKKGS